jgi:carbon monoxide dehydrogenase subunit G
MSLPTVARRAAFITPLLFALASLPALLPATGHAASIQGSGKTATENRTVGDFEAIAASGSMEIVVRQGAQPALQVEADDNLLPLLETVVESGSKGATLHIRWKKGESMNTRSKVKVTVVASKLSALSNAGSGDIRLEAFKTPALQITLAGSGETRLKDLATDDLAVRISGSGDVSGSGSAGKLAITIAGSGDVRLTELRSDDVSISIAGSGDAAVNAQKTLNVRIAGSGDVTYVGDASVKSSVAGSGSVKKK